MAETILYGIAVEVLKRVGSNSLNEIASTWGFKSRLVKLNNTINTLKNVLLDAEERQADSHAVRGWLERLTAAVYAADDLFDEFATLVARKQHLGGSTMTTEVLSFFSSSNQIALAYKFSHNIKKIRQELDDIVRDGKQFSFILRHHDNGSVMNTSRKRDETYSFVDTDEIIGRDGDKKAVLDLLLPSSTVDEHEVLPVIPIVGMGGMGKTTLAQLIYNDPQVQDCFKLKLWVCVSDVFDIKAIIEKIIMSTTKSETPKLDMNSLQGLLRKEVGDKKYLLVLDDVWNENREVWLELRALLKIGRSGSKILVTTRSRKVAKIMGTVSPYELQGLSKERSRELFEKVAFEPGQATQKPHLVKIGKEILKKCGDVPLAIRTLGSLLYGEDESKWLSLKDTSLAKISESSDNQSDIMNILKLSYHHLWSPLKKCFAYCALFPKDHWFDKEMLIDLWMAEGFIIPDAKENQSLDKVAEQYFLTLLQRGFFQDIIMNEWGEIKSCKMHDFMHDLAQEVAGIKCKVAETSEDTFDEKVLHLSFAYPLGSSWEIPNSMLNLKWLRTFLLLGQMDKAAPFGESVCQQLLTRFCTLRVLDLNHLGLKSLPSSIDKLTHLRYLNLSHTPLEKLPDSITDLWNLQTLTLRDCRRLRTLPTDIWKLANLRSLDVSGCDKLTQMPSGIEGLTMLNKLPQFIVGHESNTCTGISAKLSNLKNLNNLRGAMKMRIHRNSENNMLAAEAELSHKHGFTDMRIRFVQNGCLEDEVVYDHDEAVLEGLRPYSSIRILRVDEFSGRKLPSWARMDNLSITLPNLVRITLTKFECCQELPNFSQLRSLKHLVISRVTIVEYMETGISNFASPKAQGLSEMLFFPSLEALELTGMTNLKGWWKVGESIDYDKDAESSSSSIYTGPFVPRSMQFSKLKKLKIVKCPNLRMLPRCPIVEDLTLRNANKRMSVLRMATTTPCTSSSGSGLKLKRLKIDNAEDLMSLPNQCLHQLSDLTITDDRKLESSEKLGEVFATLSSSLRSLEFHNCDRLKSISQGLQHLTVLENLKLKMCEELDITGNEDEDSGMPWKAFNTSLRSLELLQLDKLVSLPSGLKHLANLCTLELLYNDELKELPEWISCFTSLEYLELSNCPKLKYLPDAFCNLTSLNQLRIERCPGLTERCRRPNGSDLHKIQHIPLLSVLD